MARQVRQWPGAPGKSGSLDSSSTPGTALPRHDLRVTSPPLAPDRERRRALGAWATPAWLVDGVLDVVLAGMPPPRSVLDPACGDGRFLAAAARRWPDAELHGVDVDPDALRDARAALGPAARLHEGDGLRLPDRRGFDLVVGNPPYLSQLARRSSRRGRSTLGGGPYADAAALFLARAADVVDRGRGSIALVLPRSVLATRDVAPIRASSTSELAVTGLWADDEAVFDAAVRTVVLAFRAGVVQGPVTRWRGRSFTPARATALPGAESWSPLVADLVGVPEPVVPDGAARLGALAAATADFRDQYYGLVGHVHDGDDGVPLVTSGLIDPGACAWGRRPVKFARATYAAPRVSLAGLRPSLQDWAARRLVPKVLLATQTSVLEACADEAGELLPAVPVISVVPHDPGATWRVAAALCSPVASAWAAHRSMGAGLSPTALRLRASQVAEVPVPPRPWDGAVEALRAGDLAAFGAAMCAAHEVDAAPLLTWWLPLAERARDGASRGR
jgi:hypothetical protein